MFNERPKDLAVGREVALAGGYMAPGVFVLAKVTKITPTGQLTVRTVKNGTTYRFTARGSEVGGSPYRSHYLRWDLDAARAEANDANRLARARAAIRSGCEELRQDRIHSIDGARAQIAKARAALDLAEKALEGGGQ